MSKHIKISCARPNAGPVIKEIQKRNESKISKQEVSNMILIGKKAPDFTAPAYYNGGFVNIKLSDYLGKWVILCFYPGDFTFV